MMCLPILLLALSSRSEKVWYIDANNLLGHRGTPKDPERLVRELRPIASSDQRVLVVFDGAKQDLAAAEVDPTASGSMPPASTIEDSTDHDLGDHFRCISLEPGQSADDYILLSIDELHGPSSHLSGASQPRTINSDIRIQIVTADRDLRRKARNYSLVRSVINPVTFWRRYLPRLSGAKKGRSSAQQGLQIDP
jgi:hypothetical protein